LYESVTKRETSADRGKEIKAMPPKIPGAKDIPSVSSFLKSLGK
jgi:hypothetical protein